MQTVGPDQTSRSASFDLGLARILIYPSLDNPGSKLYRYVFVMNGHYSSRKHAYILLTPLNPTFVQ